MKKLLSFAVALSVLLSFALLVRISSAQDSEHMWTDTFADTSLIESMIDVTQVTDVTGFGTSFTLYEGNPLLTLESCDPWDADGDITKQIPAAVHPDVLYFPEGMDGYEFWMIFTPFGEVPSGGSGTPDYWWERMTLVRSNDGINWEKTPDYENPLVVPGDPGDWDDGWHADPDFVYAPGKGPGGESWFLYYTGCGSGGCHIALALSHDGKHYTKYGTGPVSPAYRCPAVIYDDATGIFHMWYNWGAYDVGYATSIDGINWDPYHPTNPGQWGYIVYGPTPGTYDQGGVSHMDVIYYDGQYWMYYLAMPTAAYAGLVIGLATSPDGINWTQHPNPVVTPEGQEWQFSLGDPRSVLTLYRPTAAVVGDTMYLYYCGGDKYLAYPGCYDFEVGLAFSEMTGPDGHVELERYFEPAEYAERLEETMAWYHMNEGPSEPVYPGEYTSAGLTLAWYHFNEETGLTALDSGGSIEDDGTLNGPTRIAGLYDGGLSFDGDDRVTVPNSAELNPTDAITIEAWVNPSVDKANNYIVCKMTPGSGDYSYGIKLERTYTGYTEIGAFITATDGTLYMAYGGSVPLGEWTHIAMTYEVNPTEETHIKLYQNGVELTYRATDTIPANTSIRTSTGPLNIGVIPISTPLYYVGIMDELRILGRALTAEEIAADGMISAPTVLDSSDNENHGSPQGGASWTSGKFSYGLEFDGSTAYVGVPHSDTLNTEEEIAIEAWVNPAVDKANNYVAIKMIPGSSPHDYCYGLKIENTYTGYSEIGGVIKGDDGQNYFAYGGMVPTEEWTHVAMTYQTNPMEDTHIKLYKNGVEVPYRYGAPDASTETIPFGTLIHTNDGPLNIGCIPVGTPLYFNGVMDELRILNIALTASEILGDSGRGYEPVGNLTSELITPPAGKLWGNFYATDEYPDDTMIEYSILDGMGAVIHAPVSSGDDISSLGSTPIQLYAELTTPDSSITPILDDWSVTFPIIEVDIDIKPGSDTNSINLGSHGVIPVAILSTSTFDAIDIDPSTVTLGGLGVAVRGKGSKLMAHAEDVNGDGLLDLVVQVETENLDANSFQDGSVILTGETYGGIAIQGADEITIVPESS